MKELTEWMRRGGIVCGEDVSGGRLTTFGSGGAVKCVAEPRDERQLTALVGFLEERGVPYRVLGGGSNVLLSDEGYAGVIVRTRRLDGLIVEGASVTAYAGVGLPLLSRRCRESALSGAEFAEGIPGTVGGAVYMNASAFGYGVSDVLYRVRILHDGRVEEIPASELKTGYHRGGLPARAILLAATFRLTEGDEARVSEKMRTFAERRAATQPRERSAGSVFTRVGEVPAAVYIERTGLKGTRIGGAELSTKHCNFIVNRGGATTTEYFRLAEGVRLAVENSSGVSLEYEVEYIGC